MTTQATDDETSFVTKAMYDMVMDGKHADGTPTRGLDSLTAHRAEDKTQAMLHKMATVQIEATVARVVKLNIMEGIAKAMNARKVKPLDMLKATLMSEASAIAIGHATRH